MLLPIPLKPAASSNLLINRLEEVAGFRGIGSWIPEAAACTLLIRYIRENFKIATFSCLSGTYKIHTLTIFLSVILNFAYFFKAIVRINLQPATPVNDAQFLREYEFVLAANSSNPEQDSSGDNQMQIRIPLSVTADWKVTGKSEPAILEYNITEPRYFFFV